MKDCVCCNRYGQASERFELSSVSLIQGVKANIFFEEHQPCVDSSGTAKGLEEMLEVPRCRLVVGHRGNLPRT